RRPSRGPRRRRTDNGEGTRVEWTWQRLRSKGGAKMRPPGVARYYPAGLEALRFDWIDRGKSPEIEPRTAASIQPWTPSTRGFTALPPRVDRIVTEWVRRLGKPVLGSAQDSLLPQPFSDERHPCTNPSAPPSTARPYRSAAYPCWRVWSGSWRPPHTLRSR